MKRYKKFKPSGIEWIGEMPEHWDIKRIKFNSYIKARVGWHGLTSSEYQNDGPYLVTGTDFEQGRINWDTCYHVGLGRYEEDPFIQLKEDDLLITKDGTIGKVAVVKNLPGKATLNSGVFVVRPTNEDYLPNYFFWLLRSSLFFEFIKYHSKGSTINHLYQDTFQNLPFLLPSVKEQTVIADHLDCKTAQIDNLIAKKQRLVDLLNEEKAVVINQAVTKGLNPKVPMKESGIPWLGEIPAHWRIKKLKYVCSLLKDGTHLPPPRVAKGYPLLSVRNLVNGKHIQFLDDDSMISDTDFEELERVFKVKENDVLLAIVGATMGKVALVPKMAPFTIQRSLSLFRTKESLINHKYLFFFFQSNYFQNLLWNNTGFSAQPGIYLGALSNFSVTCPLMEEQKQIIEFVETQTQAIDTTISKIETELELLQEYCTALISEAVTGKIDVRGVN